MAVEFPQDGAGWLASIGMMEREHGRHAWYQWPDGLGSHIRVSYTEGRGWQATNHGRCAPRYRATAWDALVSAVEALSRKDGRYVEMYNELSEQRPGTAPEGLRDAFGEERTCASCRYWIGGLRWCSMFGMDAPGVDVCDRWDEADKEDVDEEADNG